MGDIKSRSFNNEINQTEELKKALLETLERNPGKKQVIQLNGKSSFLFANLTALTLASCGGGGGGSGGVASKIAPAFLPAAFFRSGNCFRLILTGVVPHKLHALVS